MQKLIEGIHQFQRDSFQPLQGLFENLAKGQNSETLFITCSDSRIDPSLLTQTKLGELFIMRNAGNIVPPHGASSGGEAATIEFAVAALGGQRYHSVWAFPLRSHVRSVGTGEGEITAGGLLLAESC